MKDNAIKAAIIYGMRTLQGQTTNTTDNVNVT